MNGGKICNPGTLVSANVEFVEHLQWSLVQGAYDTDGVARRSRFELFVCI